MHYFQYKVAAIVCKLHQTSRWIHRIGATAQAGLKYRIIRELNHLRSAARLRN